MLIMRMFVSCVIIYLDQLLVEVMTIIRKHSRVDYAQRGRYFSSSCSSSSNKVHPSVVLIIIELVLCTFDDKEARDLKHF